MTASVAFDGAPAAGDAQSITLPATALFHDGQQPAVWVVRTKDDTLELRRVDVARFNERTVTVSHGLQPGERVVLQGAHGQRGREGPRDRAAASGGLRIVSVSYEEGRFNLSARALRHQALVVYLIARDARGHPCLIPASRNPKTRRSRSA